MSFYDRTDAGRRLAAELEKFKGEDVVVFALPRGGAPVAEPIAVLLKAPLDLVLVRKIGVPFQPELAMGAVADGGAPVIVRNEDVIAMADVSEQEFESVCARELEEIERRRQLYLGRRERPEAKGRIAIVVDDGVATGATMIVTLEALRDQGVRKLIAAAPVMSGEAIGRLRWIADEIVTLHVPSIFLAVGGYYQNFDQVSDAEVRELLADLAGTQSQ